MTPLIFIGLGGLGLLALAGGGDGAPSGSPYGAAVVAAALRSLGVHETSPNSGPEIDAWVKELGLVPPMQWCAAAVSHWLREASKATGTPMPIGGAGAAKGLLGQFKAKGRALTADQARARALPPGTVLVWDRSEPPNSGPQGHTAIIEHDHGDAWGTIEGNTIGNDVRRITRPRTDPRLLGAGLVDGPALAPSSGSTTSSPAPSAPSSPSTPAPAASSNSGGVLMIGDSLGVGLASAMKKFFTVPFHSAAQQSTTIDQWGETDHINVLMQASGLAQRKPSLVLVSLGTNDIAGGGDANPKRAAVREIVRLVREAGSKVAWIAPPTLPPTLPAGFGVRAVLAQELAALAVPMFESDQIVIPRGGDHLHPTGEGYESWAVAIVAWLWAQGLGVLPE